VIVGVNKYKLEKEDDLDILEVDNTAVREEQVAHLKKLRAERDNTKVSAALEALTEALLDFSGPADLAAWLVQHITHPVVQASGTIAQSATIIADMTRAGDVVITMSAGDGTQVGPRLLALLEQRHG
jgi:methylmalonyl-CoA mutase N-terminal domain/subunit